MLGATDKRAWFMMQRTGESRKDGRSPLGGPGKVAPLPR